MRHAVGLYEGSQVSCAAVWPIPCVINTVTGPPICCCILSLVLQPLCQAAAESTLSVLMLRRVALPADFD